MLQRLRRFTSLLGLKYRTHHFIYSTMGPGDIFVLSRAVSQGRQVILEFLKTQGAKFQFIDNEVIEESHRVAAQLGVRTDSDTGAISLQPATEERSGSGDDTSDASPNPADER